MIDIIHAECVAAMRKLADKSVDHTITDPPYSAKTHSKGRRIVTPGTVAAHFIPYRPMTPALMRAVSHQIVRITRRWIVITCDSDSPQLWRAALEAAGAEFVRHGIFYKDDAQPQMSGDRPGTGFECVVICHAPRDSGRMRWNGGGRCARWHAMSDARQPGGLIVDGQKPLALMRQLVADFSDPGELICDPFAGGGTTAVACQELGRDCITFECDEDTYNKAQHRIREAGKQQPLPLARAKATQLQLGG